MSSGRMLGKSWAGWWGEAMADPWAAWWAAWAESWAQRKDAGKGRLTGQTLSETGWGGKLEEEAWDAG